MRFYDKKNTLTKYALFFFGLFLALLPLLGGLSKVNNAFHIALFIGLAIVYNKNSREELFSNTTYNLGLIITIIFLSYFSLSNFWGPQPNTLTSELKHSFYIITFIVLFYFSTLNGKKNTMLMLVFSSTVILCLLTLILVDKHSLLTMRLQNGFSYAPENVIDMAGFYGIGIFCGLILIRETGNKWLYLPVAILFIGILLTQSRGPLLSLIISCIPLLLLFKRVHLSHVFITGLIVIAISLLIILSSADHILLNRLEESYSQSYIRFGIWENALSYVRQKPWFGWGFNQEIDFVNEIGQRVRTTHSLYFATLLKGGVVGGLLLLSVIVYGLYMAWTQIKANQSLEASMFVFSLMFYATQGMFLISNPSVPWVMFWLPLAVVMAIPKRQ